MNFRPYFVMLSFLFWSWCAPPLAYAQEGAVGYMDSDTTLYVSPTGGNTSCASSAPCSLPNAVAAFHSRAFINKRLKLKAAAGTYTDNGVDLYGNVTDRAAFVGLEGTPVTAGLDGGHSLGLCTWGDGASPTRATCLAGASDGGWATSGLIPFYARLGPSSAAYPDGTCGTFVVESNTATTMTVEAASGTNAPYPSGCTGVLPFTILDQGTIFTGTHASNSAGVGYPPGVVALPDGGSLDTVIPTQESGPYGLAIRTGASGQGTATAYVRWVRFKPASDAAGIYLPQGSAVTADHVRCDTSNESGFSGQCLLLGGDNRVQVQHSQVLKRTGASSPGSLIGSRRGAPPSTVTGYNNVAREALWWDMWSPLTATWDVNYSAAPYFSPYVHAGATVTSFGDTVTDGVLPIYYPNGGALPSPFLTGQWADPVWSGGDASAAYVLGGHRSQIKMGGAPNIHFPNAGSGPGAVFCADEHTDIDLASTTGGTFAAGDAGFLVDYSWGCRGVFGASSTDVQNGTDGTPSDATLHALCQGRTADGGVLNERAGCLELPPS